MAPITPTVTMTVAEFLAAGGPYDSVEYVVLVDTGANIASLTPAQIAQLLTFNVDGINATDDMISLSLEQLDNLNGVPLDSSDTVTLS